MKVNKFEFKIKS